MTAVAFDTAVLQLHLRLHYLSGCSNVWYSDRNNNTTKKLSFHRLPRDESIIEKYENILNTKVSKKNVRVCGGHFKNGRRESRDELPLWQHPPKTPRKVRRAPTPRGPVPPPRPRTEHFKTYKEKLLKKQLDRKEVQVNNLKEQVCEVEKKNNELFSSLLTTVEEVKSCKEEIKQLENKLKETEFTHRKFIGSSSKMLFYTGLTNNQFNALWDFLEPEICTPKRENISQKD